MAQKAGKGHSDGVFFFWTFHKQTPVLSVLSDSVASSLFYPSEKRGSLGMITKPLFHPHLEATTNPVKMLHSNFSYIIGSGPYEVLLALL